MSSKKVQKILIIKPSALGDIALTLTALTSLRKSFPDAEISWLVRKEFAPLLEMVTDLDKIVIFDRKLLGKWFMRPKAFASLIKFFKTLSTPQFDIVIDLQGLFRTALFAWITRCPKRFGIKGARECASMFYTHKVPLDENCVHQIDVHNKIITATGVTEIVMQYNLTIDEQTESSARQLLAENSVGDKKYAILVTGAAHANKCWPAEKFAELAGKLHDRFDLSVIAVGTKMDKPVVEKLKSLAKTNIIDLTAKTDIKVLAALMSKASIVITNDTGPGHIAVAAGAPVVMIFGPTNPLRVGPYRKPQFIVAVDALTRGRQIESTDPMHAIEKVSVESVFQKVTTLVSDQQ
ncbi:MAG: glycosyltransferase family 9 protein [Planctomycetes bacterium]|nr:glycosyltransferase family 9 protein [Planctomycetota bacterium]